jgi:gas vesicle protein
VSDRDSGIGAFVLGVALGAVLGLLLAPEPGEDFKDVIRGRLRSLRELAIEHAGALENLVTEAAAGVNEPEPRIAPPPPRKRRGTTARRPRTHA